MSRRLTATSNSSWRFALWALAGVVLWWSFGAHAFAPGPAATWGEAQATEVETLRAELAALNKALVSAKASGQAAKSSLTKEVEGLSSKLSRLQVDNARRTESLPQRERLRSDRAQARHLDDLLTRLRARIGDAPPGETPEVQIPWMVERLLADIEARARLRIDPAGEYFVADGTVAQAPILHVGEVAAARWDGAVAPLIATAAGLREATGFTTRREPIGDATVATFIIHDLDAPPAPDAFVDGGWSATIDAGGPVMWVLLVIGIIAGLLATERTLGLLWARRRWGQVRARFERAVRDEKVAELLDIGGWVAQPLVIAAGSRCPSCSAPLDANLEERATQALMVMRERLQTRLSLIAIVAAVAPLLGLLGTVTGMIQTFSVVNSTGASDPQMLASGISQALLTTQLGLAIAIPAFLAHALLSRAARRILASAEQTVLRYLHGSDAIVSAAGHHHGHHHHHHHGHHHGHHHDHDHKHDHDHDAGGDDLDGDATSGG